MTDVVVNSIDDDVWSSEDEQKRCLEWQSWDLVLTMFVNASIVFAHDK